MSLPGFTRNSTVGFEDPDNKTVPFYFNCVWNQDGFLLSYVYKVRTKLVQTLIFCNFVTRRLKSFKIIE